ncbi:hypothetical protein JCM21900_001975 [Sporobolomyces salmonicolor]
MLALPRASSPGTSPSKPLSPEDKPDVGLTVVSYPSFTTQPQARTPYQPSHLISTLNEMSDNVSQDLDSKAARELKPESQQTFGDKAADKYEAAASTVQPESHKSTPQKVTELQSMLYIPSLNHAREQREKRLVSNGRSPVAGLDS